MRRRRMYSVSVIILLAFVAQADAKDARENLVETLFDRGFKVPSLHHEKVDQTLLRKPNHLAIPTTRLARGSALPNLAHSKHGGRVTSVWPSPPRFIAAAASTAPNLMPALYSSALLVTSSIPTSETWEMDFGARPVLDERGKKQWELVITDADKSFVFRKFFSNKNVNSVSLKAALQNVLEMPGAKRPTKCKFFRSKVETIITRALGELDIKPVPSRRCFGLMDVLEDLSETIHKQHPNFDEKARIASSTFDAVAPVTIDDMFMGDKWSFVQLPLEQLQENVDDVLDENYAGSVFNLQEAAMKMKLSPDAVIPGVVVFSQRASAVATWTTSFELAEISADRDRACLILDTGLNKKFLYARWERNQVNDEVAAEWEKSKQEAGGLHFMVIQRDAEADEVSGFWLMQARALPN